MQPSAISCRGSSLVGTQGYDADVLPAELKWAPTSAAATAQHLNRSSVFQCSDQFCVMEPPSPCAILDASMSSTPERTSDATADQRQEALLVVRQQFQQQLSLQRRQERPFATRLRRQPHGPVQHHHHRVAQCQTVPCSTSPAVDPISAPLPCLCSLEATCSGSGRKSPRLLQTQFPPRALAASPYSRSRTSDVSYQDFLQLQGSSSSDECEEVTRRLTAAFPNLQTRASYERRKSWSLLYRVQSLGATASEPTSPRVLGSLDRRSIDTASDVSLTPEESQVLEQRKSNHLTTGDAALELFLRLNHARQTVEFSKRQAAQFSTLQHARMGVWEALDRLDELREYEAALMAGAGTPDLDPSMSLKEHAFQTAELLRLSHPDHDWLHLVGLIHGLGKLLAHPLFGSQPQWAICGESFPLGCRFDPGIAGSQWFSVNPDRRRRMYSTQTGMYAPECGLEHVSMSWSAAEMLYLVLLLNDCSLPKEALFILRHQRNFSIVRPSSPYRHLLSDSDQALLPLLASFQQHAVYKRAHMSQDALRSAEDMQSYYDSLLKKYGLRQQLAW